MISKEKEKLIVGVSQQASALEQHCLSILGNANNQEVVLASLALYNLDHFAKSLLVDLDFASARGYLAHSAMVTLYLHERLYHQAGFLMMPVSAAVVSGHGQLLQAYWRLSPDAEDGSFSTSYFRALKAIWTGSPADALRHLKNMLKEADSEWTAHYIGLVQALEGCVNKSVPTVEAGLGKFLVSIQQAETHSLLRGSVSIEAAVVIKCAQLQGLAMDFNHPLLPVGLLQTDGLKLPPGYAFMQEWRIAKDCNS